MEWVRVRRHALGSAAALAGILAAAAGAAVHAPAPAVDFERDIRPLLAERCWSCHGPAEQKSGLRLDSRAAALKGGASGPAFAAGRSEGSALLRRITSTNPRTVMPPGRPLEPGQIVALRTWIDQGAPWPEGAGPSAPAQHWAFVPPRRSPLPAVRDSKWVKNPVDRFVLAKLETNGLRPSAAASRGELIRRVSLDLIGLPPTPEEV